MREGRERGGEGREREEGRVERGGGEGRERRGACQVFDAKKYQTLLVQILDSLIFLHNTLLYFLVIILNISRQLLLIVINLFTIALMSRNFLFLFPDSKMMPKSNNILVTSNQLQHGFPYDYPCVSSCESVLPA